MRAWWPLMWLLPTIAGMAAIAWRIAGREAAMVALLLALAGVPAYQQFTPGRIDHHNVQIALALLVTAAAAWSDRKSWTAAAAGVLTGLALAIGFESLPYLAICGGMLALRYASDPEAGAALRDYGLALAASTALALFISVGPDRLDAASLRRHRVQQRRGGHDRGPRSGVCGMAEARRRRHTLFLRGRRRVSCRGGVRAARAALRRAGRSRWSIRRSGRSGTIMCANCSRSARCSRPTR